MFDTEPKSPQYGEVKPQLVVAGGSFDQEIDTNALGEDIPYEYVKVRDSGRLVFRIDGVNDEKEKTPSVTVYPSGKYILRLSHVDSLEPAGEALQEDVANLLPKETVVEPEVSNITVNTEINGFLDIFDVTSEFHDKLEEYGEVNMQEEQFPALDFKPDDIGLANVKFHSNGKIIASGGSETKELVEIQQEMDRLFNLLGLRN